MEPGIVAKEVLGVLLGFLEIVGVDDGRRVGTAVTVAGIGVSGDALNQTATLMQVKHSSSMQNGAKIYNHFCLERANSFFTPEKSEVVWANSLGAGM